ncbi:thiol-disulfide isomerase/thioredoxin [Jatrophihabitans sp. GAS493]|uniref:TlpA disulfide reductase family protein n=1 Tax=Jatrophihabitans sp. GAS493 TaxID=1907575 RepID=UPI000BBF3FCA|nr:TlpA disulfide reductase family protein [Jatrophihabitans sp. GAS493]SOD70635.1 thiol-disulfide isomerase/thioredoxin [Jatrophihabitans sp. GAS493]
MPSRRLLALAAVLVTALTLAGCTGKDAVADSSTKGYQFVGVTSKGQVIPEKDRKPVGAVSAKLLDGSAFNLASTDGKVTLINFYASWCVPCQSETPQLANLYKELAPSGVAFVGVATKEASTSTATEFAKDEGVTYPVVYDQSAKVPLQMGHIPVLALPMTVLLDKQHRVAAVYAVRVLPADLKPTLTALQAES